MKGYEATKNNPSKSSSVISLVIVNLFPVFGVLYWDWDVFPIMLLYWSENIIIGFYNVLRMIVCVPQAKESWITKLFLIPFFIIHYGIFTLGHGAVLIGILGQSYFAGANGPRLDILVNIIQEYGLFYAMLSIFLSHGYSFVMNYLRKEEYKRIGLQKLMMRPYSRIVILHITLILGAFLVLFLNSQVYILILFILLKMGIDLWAHLREHRI
jgi:hypothetical protein